MVASQITSHFEGDATAGEAAQVSAQELRARSLAAACSAAWELDALLDMMLEGLPPNGGVQTEEVYYQGLRTRGLALRMKDLASALMCFTDAPDCPDEMEEKVFGRVLVEPAEVSHA